MTDRDTAPVRNFSSTWPIDHVGIAVFSINESRRTWEGLTGSAAGPVLDLTHHGVRVAFVGGVELVEPLAPDTPVGRFLSTRGSGLHHVAFKVGDVAAELARLKKQGFRLIDREPRRGAHGWVAFVHPGSANGVLVELVQR